MGILYCSSIILLSLIIILAFCCNLTTISALTEEDDRFEDVTASHSPPKCYPETTYGNHTFIKLKKQGITLHYVETGDRTKPLLLFLHGLPEFWLSFRHQIPYFAKSYWVVAADIRGYGDSDKPTLVSEYKLDILQADISELIHSLGRKECYIVAHDWGGTIATVLAAKNPSVVIKLVVINSGPLQVWNELRRTALDQAVRSTYVWGLLLPPNLPELGSTLGIRLWFAYLFTVTRMSRRDRQAYLCTYSKIGAFNGPINYYRANARREHEVELEDLPIVEVPTLVIWGVIDIPVSIKNPRVFHKYYKNLEIVYFPRASRTPHEQEPEKVNNLIEQFLTQS